MSPALPKIPALLIVILFAAVVEAQQATSLAGTITDENGAVVSAAKVELSSLASGRSFVTVSDAEGRYEFRTIPLGPYRIIVTAAGFAVVSRGVSWHRSGSFQEDFALAPGILESSVTVTAARGLGRIAAEAPLPITVADKSQIEERLPAATLTAIEATPNLTPVGTNPALVRPRLRGLTSNRVLVILDGDRLNNVRSDPTSGVSPSVIDVTDLDAVEVLSGAGSSLYGSDAMAGIINLVTPSVAPSDQGHYLGLRFDGEYHGNGSFRRGGVTLNWSERLFALRVGGSLFREANYGSGDRSVSGAVTIAKLCPGLLVRM